MSLVVLSTPSVDRFTKKLLARDKETLDEAVKEILKNPKAGDEKKGDLVGIFVYKFKINKQEILLAYEFRPNNLSLTEIVLLSLGSHENFHKSLKRKLLK